MALVKSLVIFGHFIQIIICIIHIIHVSIMIIITQCLSSGILVLKDPQRPGHPAAPVALAPRRTWSQLSFSYKDQKCYRCYRICRICCICHIHPYPAILQCGRRLPLGQGDHHHMEQEGRGGTRNCRNSDLCHNPASLGFAEFLLLAPNPETLTERFQKAFFG